jgi:hypothetical protein
VRDEATGRKKSYPLMARYEITKPITTPERMSGTSGARKEDILTEYGKKDGRDIQVLVRHERDSDYNCDRKKSASVHAKRNGRK